MKLLHLLLFASIFCLVTCRLFGVFDNVTVLSDDDVIFIDFDDTLSQYVAPKSVTITIRNQFIPKLENGSVSDLPTVQNLTLVKNGIREIRRGAFRNLPDLKSMNLSHNELEEIHNDVFTNLPLQDLYLDNNKISRIAYGAFSHLKLRNLFLNNNRISTWSKNWLVDSSVLVLDVSYNLIADLPPNSFGEMTVGGDLTVVFTGNQLRKINSDVFNGFERYQRISLDGNLIENLDADAFNGVKYVNILNLNGNSISAINSDVFRDVRVDVLMLEDNRLRCLSTDMFRMEELDIDGNPITCFCVKTWLDWRDLHSNPSIYHITNLEQDCI